jgi:hypothetical protein
VVLFALSVVLFALAVVLFVLAEPVLVLFSLLEIVVVLFSQLQLAVELLQVVAVECPVLFPLSPLRGVGHALEEPPVLVLLLLGADLDPAILHLDPASDQPDHHHPAVGHLQHFAPVFAYKVKRQFNHPIPWS